MTMTSEPVFRKGDRALYPLVGSEVEVEVLEECGPVGFGGRRIVRIRVPVACSDPYEVEVAEARLRPVTDAA
jgi:hypothetical protein